MSVQNLHYPVEIADQQILTIAEWCSLNRISLATARPIISRGEISTVRLSVRRLGISLAEHKRWRAARTRSGA